MIAVSRLFKIEGERVNDEAWLQKYLAGHPELLPLRDLEGVESKLRLVGIELGGIDLLFIDERGLLTIVETKLVKNPEARREVVAQVFDYASTLSKLDVNQLCRMIADQNGKESIKGIDELQELSAAIGRHLNEAGDSAKAVLASYVLRKKIVDNPNPSRQDKEFLGKLDAMLREGSFRLVIVVTEQASESLLSLLNYVNSTMRRGCQLVAVELSVEKLDGQEYFVPHLVGAPNLLSAEYYRTESFFKRINKDWSLDEFMESCSTEVWEDIERVVSEVSRRDYLKYEFGHGKTGGLLIGLARRLAGRKINILDLESNGEVRLYTQVGTASRLPEATREELMKLYERTLPEKHYKDIIQKRKEQMRYIEVWFPLSDLGPQGKRWEVIISILEGVHNIIDRPLN